jgi:hypothetical protein
VYKQNRYLLGSTSEGGLSYTFEIFEFYLYFVSSQGVCAAVGVFRQLEIVGEEKKQFLNCSGAEQSIIGGKRVQQSIIPAINCQ